MSTRSGRIRSSAIEASPPRTRKGVSPPRSPARTRKTSPGRKTSPPARSTTRKSPARKSPSRKSESKFPARKSPSRTTKSADVSLKSPAKPKVTSKLEVKLHDFADKHDVIRSRSRRTEYSIKDLSTGITQSELTFTTQINGDGNYLESKDAYNYGLRNRKPTEEVAPRRSSRLRDFIENVPDIRNSLSKSVSKSVSKSIDTFSDEENSEEDLIKEKSGSVTRKLATPLRGSINKQALIGSRWEFGGRMGSAILILLLPLTVFSILISCIKKCSVNSILQVSTYKALSWFSIPAITTVALQLSLQAVLSVLTIFGTKADRMDDSGKKQCFNALFSATVTITALFALDFFKIYNSVTLLKEYLQLATALYTFAVILAIVLYLKSRNIDDSELNPYGNTGFTLYDFSVGREIHPKLKKLDVKVWISRISNITTLTLAVLIFKHGIHVPKEGLEKLELDNYKELVSKVQLKPTILIFSLMQIVYSLNFIMKEYKITTTFFWQSEGVGYIQLVSSALYPFYFTTISKYIIDANITLSTNILISASVLFVLGFGIMLASNNIKYEFRKNPLHPSLANLDSMPTFHGKKLLISGLWGVLRHPNYAGDILIHIALACPGIFGGELVAAVPALLTILALCYRAWRDHARCKRRYGAAWQRYCKKTPSVLIPKVL